MFELVEIFLTRRCPLRCSYCGLVRDDFPEVENYEKWLEVLESLSSNVKTINFAGAEPLMYEDIDKVIEKANNCEFSYTISTLGLHISKLKKLLDIGLKGISLSCDSLKDNFIDNASEKKSRHTLTLLDKVKEVPLKFVGITVNQKNYVEVEDFVREFWGKGWRVCVNLMHPEANGKLVSAGKSFVLTGDQIKALSDRLVNLLVKENLEAGACPEVYALWKKDGGKFKFKCSVGATLLIDANLTLGVCSDYKGLIGGYTFRDVCGIAPKWKWSFLLEESIKDCPGCLNGGRMTATLVHQGKIPSERLL